MNRLAIEPGMAREGFTWIECPSQLKRAKVKKLWSLKCLKQAGKMQKYLMTIFD